MSRRAGTGVRTPSRVALDTNVVLSALVFRKGVTAQLRTAWQSRAFVPLVSTATAQELVRVLSYPKFRLDETEQRELLADYLPYAEAVAIPTPPPRVPACRDIDDLHFLYLAAVGRAGILVTGDSDLLALAARVRYAIKPPEVLLHSLTKARVGK